MKLDQSPACWIEAFTGSRWRVIGCVMVAGIDAPDAIRGRTIFYRSLKRWEDSYMRRDQSIGFDLAVYNHLKLETQVEFVVTFAQDTEQMNIALIDDFSFSRNYGQGIQMRASIADTVTLQNAKPLKYPNAIPHIKVRSEEPESSFENRNKKSSSEKRDLPF
jgi:hypothetical protein